MTLQSMHAILYKGLKRNNVKVLLKQITIVNNKHILDFIFLILI